MATRDEMETTVVYDHAAQKYRVWSSYRPHISKFLGDERVRVLGQGNDWAEFEIPAEVYDVRNGFKRRMNLSDEQREAAAARLKSYREAKQ